MKTPPQVGPGRGFQRAVRLGWVRPGHRTERQNQYDTPKRKIVRTALPSIVNALIQFGCCACTTVRSRSLTMTRPYAAVSACKMELEGTSRRRIALSRGRSPDWLKFKSPRPSRRSARRRRIGAGLPYGPVAPSLHPRPNRWQHPTTCQSSSKIACTFQSIATRSRHSARNRRRATRACF
jgi:hypothetical protein